MANLNKKDSRRTYEFELNSIRKDERKGKRKRTKMNGSCYIANFLKVEELLKTSFTDERKQKTKTAEATKQTNQDSRVKKTRNRKYESSSYVMLSFIWSLLTQEIIPYCHANSKTK